MTIRYVSANGVSSTGSDIFNPCSLATFDNLCQAGDVAKMLDTGGNYLDQRFSSTAASGIGDADNQRIIYEAFTGHTPLFTSSNNSGRLHTNLTFGRSWITFRGIHCYGGPLFFTQATFDFWVDLENATGVTFDYCNFSYAQGWGALNIHTGSSYIKVLNSTMDAVGFWDRYDYVTPPAHDDAGHVVDIENGAHHILIDNCTLTRGGHTVIQNNGDYLILRRTIFDNYWLTYTGVSFEHKQGFIDPGDQVGNRCFEVDWYSDYVVVEDCIFRHTPESVDESALGTGKFTGEHNIFRRNLVFNAAGEGIKGSVGGSHRECKYNYTYHNTFYGLGGPVFSLEAFNNRDAAPVGNVFKNNASDVSRTNPPYSTWNADLVFQRLYEYYPTEANPMLDNIVAGNFIGNATGDPIINVNGVGGAGKMSITTAQATYPDQIYGNATGNPLFVNPSTDYNVADFSLQEGSPCRDAGQHLTTTTAIGSNTKVIPVADPYYFIDGFGLITGDSIKVGSNNAVTITGINYATKQLTVDTSISFASGDPVNLAAFMPAGNTQPDIGAIPYGGAPGAVVQARDDLYDLETNSGVTVLSPQPSANDTSFSSYVSAGPAVHGTVNINAGNIEYQPPANFSGVDSFPYTIQDSAGNQSTATVWINVASDILEYSSDTFILTEVAKKSAWQFNVDIGGGADRIVLIGLGTETNVQADNGAASITLNGQPLSKVTNSDAVVWGGSFGNGGEFWRIQESALPAAGTYTLAITTNGDCYTVGGVVITLKNQKQAAPEAADKATALNTNQITRPITTLTDNAWVFSLVVANDPTTFTVGATGADSGQLEREDFADSTMTIALSTRQKAEAGTVTDGWTAAASQPRMVMSIIAVQPNYQYQDDFIESSDTVITSHTPDQVDSGQAYFGTSGAIVVSSGAGGGVKLGASDWYRIPVKALRGVAQIDFTAGGANNHLIFDVMAGDLNGSPPDNCYAIIMRYANNIVQVDKYVLGVKTPGLVQAAYTLDNTKRYRLEIDNTTPGTTLVYLTDLTAGGAKTLVTSVADNTVTRGGYLGARHGTRNSDGARIYRMSFAKGGTIDTTGPGQVTGLVATAASASSVTLAWNQLAGASAYRIYRATSASPAPASNPANKVTDVLVPTLTYEDTGLAEATQYFYQVVGLDEVYNPGTASVADDATTLSNDNEPPSVPTGLAATALVPVSGEPYFSTTISWSASTDNVGVTAYDVLRADGIMYPDIAALAFTDNRVEGEIQTSYQVRAKDLAGNLSGWSSPVTAYVNTTTSLALAKGYADGNASDAACEGAYAVSPYIEAVGMGEAKTNVVEYSKDFTQTQWVKSLCSIQGQKIIEDTSAGEHLIRCDVVLDPNTDYTAWIRLKKGERYRAGFHVWGHNWALSNPHVWLNLNTGTVDFWVPGDYGLSHFLIDLQDGTYLVGIKFNSGAGASSPRVVIQLVSPTSSDYTGDGTSGLECFHVQVEKGGATNSIITTGTQKTRVAAGMVNSFGTVPADNSALQVAAAGGSTVTGQLQQIIQRADAVGANANVNGLLIQAIVESVNQSANASTDAGVLIATQVIHLVNWAAIYIDNVALAVSAAAETQAQADTVPVVTLLSNVRSLLQSGAQVSATTALDISEAIAQIGQIITSQNLNLILSAEVQQLQTAQAVLQAALVLIQNLETDPSFAHLGTDPRRRIVITREDRTVRVLKDEDLV